MQIPYFRPPPIAFSEIEHRDALRERIAYLKKRERRGDKWVDNDTTASPDAWKSLETYTTTSARRMYRKWD
jgi:hypothetical protein